MPEPVKRDVSSFAEKLKAASLKKITEKPVVKAPDESHLRKVGQEAAEHRRKRKEAETSLSAAKLQLEEMEAQITELKAENTRKDAAIADMKGNADNWKKYEAGERKLLEDSLPVELRGDAKNLPLKTLKTFVDRINGTGASAAKGGDSGKSADAEMEEAVKNNDTAKINELLDKQIAKP